MKTTKTLLIVALALSVTTACSSSEPVPDDDATAEATEVTAEEDVDEAAEDEEDDADTVRQRLKTAADGEHRSEDDRERNQYRNPVDTLEFFGFESDATVVELWPGGGWYTGVLAPSLTDDGALHAGIFEIDDDDPEDYRTKITLEYLDWLDEHPSVFGDVETGTFAPPDTVELGEPESADLVVTFRNLHNTYDAGTLDDVLAAVYEVLKPGATFGVVQHRAPEGSDPDETASDGYLAEDFVIETIEDAGFELEDTSEINANPDDTADHPDGVWSLPPTLRGGDDTADEFLEIGESDRMTLRFSKPDN